MDYNQNFYLELIENLTDGIYFVDRERRILYWNKGAERITGFSKEEVIGTRCLDNILTHVTDQGVNLCQSACPLLQTLQDGKNREADVFLHHRDGHRQPVQVRVAPVRNAAGEITGAVELFSDNSPSRALQQRVKDLEALAMLDPLTNLANRRYIQTQVEVHLEKMHRFGWPFGLLFWDIDRFKQINDTYGHDAGDEVLKCIAGTLSSNLRPFDIPGRWGGDELVTLIPNVDKNALLDIASRLLALARESYIVIGAETLRVSMSMGATLALPDDSAESLVKRADDLMYLSKKAGGNRVSMEGY